MYSVHSVPIICRIPGYHLHYITLQPSHKYFQRDQANVHCEITSPYLSARVPASELSQQWCWIRSVAFFTRYMPQLIRVIIIVMEVISVMVGWLQAPPRISINIASFYHKSWRELNSFWSTSTTNLHYAPLVVQWTKAQKSSIIDIQHDYQRCYNELKGLACYP